MGRSDPGQSSVQHGWMNKLRLVHLIRSATGYECMKCVVNAVPPGQKPPVAIWTVPPLFTRWYA
jgi:hypothetical protein